MAKNRGTEEDGIVKGLLPLRAMRAEVEKSGESGDAETAIYKLCFVKMCSVGTELSSSQSTMWRVARGKPSNPNAAGSEVVMSYVPLSSTRRKSEPVVLNRATGGGGGARSTVRAPETALDTTRPFTGMVRTKESEDQTPLPMSPA